MASEPRSILMIKPALWKVTISLAARSARKRRDRIDAGIEFETYRPFTSFVASNRVVPTSESVRTAGTNPDVLRTSRIVPGDDCLLTCDL